MAIVIAETYKGVPIEDRSWNRRRYSFNFYAIHKAGERAGTFKMNQWYGNPEWTAETLEEAHREIDRFLVQAGISEVIAPSGRADVAPEPDGTERQAVAILESLTIDRARDLYRKLSDPASMIMASLEDGIQWARWRLRHVGGMIGFVHMTGPFPDWSELDSGDVDLAYYFVASPQTDRFREEFAKAPHRPATVIYGDGSRQFVA